LNALDTKKLFKSKKTNQDTPFILLLLKKCESYNIPYQMMCDLNYTDLLALIIEYDIETIAEHYKQLERQRLQKQNIEVQDLNEESVVSFLKK
jgi:hypothetical protein